MPMATNKIESEALNLDIKARAKLAGKLGTFKEMMTRADLRKMRETD